MIWLLALVLALGAFVLWTSRTRRILSSKRHIEAIFDHLDPMVVVDRDLRILRVNRRFAELLQQPFADLLWRPLPLVLGRFLPPTSEIKDAVVSGKPAQVVELPWPGPGGDRRFDLHIYPVEMASNNRPGAVALRLQDTTELAAARQELVQQNLALARLTETLGIEIEMAREIQSGLLPRDLPRVDGLQFIVRYRPSRPVGGDLYDAVLLDDRHLGFFIADVSGHGLPAAFEAALVRMSFLNHAHVGTSPAVVFANMNRDLRRSLALGHYVTAFYGVLDLSTLRLTYCRASHPKPVLHRKDGSIERLGSQGLFLGIVEEAGYQEAELDLASGDRLLLFTDGYYETSDSDGKRMGYERFVRALVETRDEDLDSLLSAMEKDQFDENDIGKEDDRTFMALRVTGLVSITRRRVLTHIPDKDAEVHRFCTSQEAWALVDRFVEALQEAGWPARDVRRAQLAASELCVNAVVHGLRDRLDGEIHAAWAILSESCHFAVSDDGSGFNVDSLPDPRKPERLGLDHGRGIFLVKKVSREVRFDHGGTTVTILLAVGDNPSASEST